MGDAPFKYAGISPCVFETHVQRRIVQCLLASSIFFSGEKHIRFQWPGAELAGFLFSFLGGKECRNGGKEEIKPRLLSRRISSLVVLRIREKAGAGVDGAGLIGKLAYRSWLFGNMQLLHSTVHTIRRKQTARRRTKGFFCCRFIRSLSPVNFAPQ